MTKERKIEILKDLLIQLSDSANILCTCEADERCEVVEECIKALEQQSSDDCVSRAEVLNLVRFNAFHVKSQIKAIENMPPVTPTRKAGKWIPVHHIENKITYDSWKCSECQHDFDSEEESTVYFDEYKYCPNCGADMRGSEPEIKNCDNCAHHTDADEIYGITPCGSCGVDLKNFKQK